MEAIQPFLIALLALNLAVFVPLLVRRVRERLGRTRDQQVIEAATPLMLARLAAIGGGPAAVAETPPDPAAMVPSVSAEAPSGVVLTIDRSPAVVTAAPVPAAVVVATPDAAVVVATREAVPSTAVVATPRPAPDMPQVMASRRRVWRDASAALVVFASIGLVVVLALPAIGPPAPTPPASAVAAIVTDAPTATIEATLPAVALASIPLPTRVEVALPTEAPTPTLPVTQTPRPTERVAAVRATPRPTSRPTPRPTPKPTPKPTPIPDPIARFTCDFSGGFTFSFHSTSKYAKAYSWDFGDGQTATKTTDPSHTYDGSGRYRVQLTVTNASGKDTATHYADAGAGTCN